MASLLKINEYYSSLLLLTQAKPEYRSESIQPHWEQVDTISTSTRYVRLSKADSSWGPWRRAFQPTWAASWLRQAVALLDLKPISLQLR